MWGGRYNPVAVVDRTEEAVDIVEAYRPDVVVPIGDSETVKAFPKRFPHLISPFFHDELFVGQGGSDARAQVLDIHNLLVHVNDKPAWTELKNKGLRQYQWDATDALTDIFLIHLGQYPDVADTGIDYRGLLVQVGDAAEVSIDAATPIPENTFEYLTVSSLPRYGLERHYNVRARWNYPGFFLGDASDFDDLVCFWNLRASDVPVFFIDRNHVGRFQHVIPAYTKITKAALARRQFEVERNIAIWIQRKNLPADINAHAALLNQIFGTGPFMICGMDQALNGPAPTMILGQASQLGVVSSEYGKRKFAFSLSDKPYYSETFFHTQHLVASLDFIGGLYDDELHTLDPPYVPELNEFYARTMHFDYNKLRIEPGRVGLIVDAADSDAFVYALPVADLFAQIFRLAGFNVQPSAGGLIARQLIAQMDGLRGTAVFKIPGVRRLLKTFGPADPFTASDAINKIGSKDPTNPSASFKDYEDLYIEARPHGTKLKARDVFTYLVAKRLFRIGSRLNCPHCRMNSWIALDNLKQRVTCEMCGEQFDATRQLVAGDYHYRRSGVLGGEKNSQGAIPVILTLQQLQSNMSHGLQANLYSTSLELVPIDSDALPKCEVDFVWLVNGQYPDKTAVIVGECKDRGRDAKGGAIDLTDIGNLKTVANSLPSKRFDGFVLLAKLCPFTDEEVASARAINDRYRQRAILLTERELEPWRIYERRAPELGHDAYAGSPTELARNTARIYFSASAPVQNETPVAESPPPKDTNDTGPASTG